MDRVEAQAMTLSARQGSHGPSELTRLQRENEQLRAEVERLRAREREAFRAGFWHWCGPANPVELELVIKEEQEGWEEWTAKP